MLTRRTAVMGMFSAPFTGVLAAHAQSREVDLDKLTLRRLIDSEAGFRILVPSDADIDDTGLDTPLTEGLLENGRRMLTISWEGRSAHVERFKIGFDFYHIDWLTAQAELTGRRVVDLQMFVNDAGLVGGRMLSSDAAGPGEETSSYLFIIGKNAFYIHAETALDELLVELLAGGVSTDKDDPWNELDPTKPFDFAGLSFEIRKELSVTDLQQEEASIRLIHDAETLGDSRMLVVVTQETGMNGPSAKRDFLTAINNLQLVHRVIDQDTESMTLAMFSEDKTLFRGYMRQAGDVYIGLVTEWVTEDPILWLAARKLYTDASFALDEV